MNMPHVIDITEANFQTEVLQRSMQQPVIVDLWATWCGPCKTLSPVLEGLAEDGEGQWTLAKIDVDANPRLAAQFQAQSIPMVLAIFQGQIVHEFAGALPKNQIERWLQAIFQACGLTLTAKVPEVPVPTEPEAAKAHWRAVLVKTPEDTRAKLALGRLLLTGGAPEEGEKLLNEIPGAAPEFGAARAALALKQLVAEIGEAGGEAAILARLETEGRGDPELTYLEGIIHGAAGRFAPGLELLVSLVATTREPMRGKAQKAATLILEAAGRNDDHVELQRKRLTRLLF
jgi:putative thioredoxin